LFGIEHIIPRRHVALAVGYRIDETRVSVARKSTQVDCPLRITHASAVARCTMAREQISALLNLLRREFQRAFLSCGAHAEERHAEAQRLTASTNCWVLRHAVIVHTNALDGYKICASVR
jgi:hypothetical protein